MSCQDGIKWDVLLSAPSTCLIAVSCSSMRSIIFCCDPQLVGQSATEEHLLRFKVSYALAISCFLFQLQLKVESTFLATPRACTVLASFVALPIALWRMWPKHERCVQMSLRIALMMLLPQSVVRHTCLLTSIPQDSSVSCKHSARFSPVWSSGQNTVWRHLVHRRVFPTWWLILRVKCLQHISRGWLVNYW